MPNVDQILDAYTRGSRHAQLAQAILVVAETQGFMSQKQADDLLTFLLPSTPLVDIWGELGQVIEAQTMAEMLTPVAQLDTEAILDGCELAHFRGRSESWRAEATVVALKLAHADIMRGYGAGVTP